LEIYKGSAGESQESLQMEDDVLEFNLDEEESLQASRTLAIGVFHSQKSYNPQVLFADMLRAWGIQKLLAVEKVGGYIFKIEFGSEEEKDRVLDGGPWRHKGDVLIVIHYDGLMRPSQIKIQTLGMWVRFYDLPPAMTKEAFAKQLGERIRKFIRMDGRYPGYLRIRVDYPLEKPLMPQMLVRIKG
jgi:hypothetical protein